LVERTSVVLVLSYAHTLLARRHADVHPVDGQLSGLHGALADPGDESGDLLENPGGGL
jgi:hypothetical protein